LPKIWTQYIWLWYDIKLMYQPTPAFPPTAAAGGVTGQSPCGATATTTLFGLFSGGVAGTGRPGRDLLRRRVVWQWRCGWVRSGPSGSDGLWAACPVHIVHDVAWWCSCARLATRGSLGQRHRAWWWRPPLPSEVVGRLDVDLWIPQLILATSWRGAASGENWALTPVKAGDGGVQTPLPCWRHHRCSSCILTCVSPGETLDPGIRIERWWRFWCHSPLRGHCLRSSSWMEVARGGAVCVCLVNDNEYLRCGAARSLCLIGLDGLV
jgi:hypothetical protein